MIFLKIMKIIVSPTDNIAMPYEIIDKVRIINGIDKSIPEIVSIDDNVTELPSIEKLGNADKNNPKNLISILKINSINSVAVVSEPNTFFSKVIFIEE
tara:strand:+ start:925 stop:1218 length:294 start_codon:yes stop_codon:yes gene_type:complete